LDVSGFHGLDNAAVTGTLLEGEAEFGEGEATERVDHTGELVAVNEDALIVEDINNNANFTVIFTEVNVGNTASFDVSSEHLKSQGVLAMKLTEFFKN
jgi:hypothetical protein